MNNRLKIFFLIFFGMLLYSCTCEKLYFTKGEKYWVNAYEKGDLVILESSLNSLKRDTLFILDKIHSLPTGNCNYAVSNRDPEFYRIDYKYSHDGKISDSNYLIQHAKEKETSIPVIRIYDIEFSSSDISELKDTTVVLKHFGKQQCYAFSKFQNFNNLPKFKIKKFLWSKQLGLVKVIVENGEELELLKKVKSNH